MKKLQFFLALLLMTQVGFSQVGINTTTPNAQLDIKSSNQAAPANNDGILIPKIDAFPVINPTIAQNGMMVFLTAPANKSGFYYWDNPNTVWKGVADKTGWSLTGNAGTNPLTNFIGTTDDKPLVFKLNNQWAGSIDSQLRNTYFGFSAGNDTGTGFYNIGLGPLSLNKNTTGQLNIGIGLESLRENLDGIWNTAIGSNSLTNNLTGSNNVAFGYAALYQNQTGSDNTANGFNSLLRNKFGSGNVGFGNNTLSENQAGSNGIAIGKDAMYYANSTNAAFENKNIAIGFESLKGSTTAANNTGNSNTAIGYQTLTAISTGNGNTASGYRALAANSTGNFNTAIGNAALSINTAGSGNIALGYQAGFNETGSNKLYVENSNSTTPLIYGEFDTDLVKVYGNIKVDNITTAGNEMQLVNKNNYVHGSGNQIFGSGGDDFILSSQETSNESAGVYGDGNAVSIWSAGDANQGQPAALVYFMDEDSFSNANTNPYDNTALKSYISPAGAYVQISDKNKKENIVQIEDALEKVTQLNGYTYQFKLAPSEIEKGDKTIQSSGVLAQELEKVLPEAVQKSKAGDYFVDYAAVTPLLIEAIKEQNEKIIQLETTNNEILKRLEKLENK